jgi:Cof subfamily protein (haloacid dehalogenase superfamily)
MSGWIALDIDGTVTMDHLRVPDPVIHYLKTLQEKGWKIGFFTGRSFSLALQILSNFEFPLFLSPQNGASLFEMPAKKMIFQRYLTKDSLVYLQEKSEHLNCAMLVYSSEDMRCYWKSSSMNLQQVQIFLDQFHQQHLFPLEDMQAESFPLVQFFGSVEPLKKLQLCLRLEGKMQSSLIRHPFVADAYLLLVTDREVNKGSALRELLKREGKAGQVIAAGNDENDLSLLQEADVKIVMADAPQHVRKCADLIAPSALECGILQALKKIIP